MTNQSFFKYNILKNDKNEICLYISHKKECNVDFINLEENDIQLNYNNDKKLTLKNIRSIDIDNIISQKEIWLIELDKEDILVKMYKVKINYK
jgi:hypothetical protein